MQKFTHYIRVQAGWRARKAIEYPEDSRNAKSARALADLADFYGSDTVDETVYDVLEKYAEFSSAGDVLLSAGEEVGRLVARYGFDNAPPPSEPQHIAALEEFAVVGLAETYELVRDTGPTSNADVKAEAEHFGLDTWEIEAAWADVPLDISYFRKRSRMTPEQRRDWIASRRENGATLG